MVDGGNNIVQADWKSVSGIMQKVINTGSILIPPRGDIFSPSLHYHFPFVSCPQQVLGFFFCMCEVHLDPRVCLQLISFQLSLGGRFVTAREEPTLGRSK